MIKYVGTGKDGKYTALLFQVTISKDTTEKINLTALWNMAKKEAIKYIKKSIDKNIGYDYVFVSELPCSNKLKFRTFEEIMNLPIKDVTCPCNNPQHRLIEFKLIGA